MSRFSRNAGFGLIELMVAMVIGLILMAGMISIVINSSRTHQELSQSSRQLDNGRYAMQLLLAEIQHAGFYGEFDALTDPPASLPDPCSTNLADLELGMTLPIQGYADAASLSCLAAGDHVAGTDILVLRRASTRVAAAAPADKDDLLVGQVYLQGAPRAYRLAAWDPGDDVFDRTDLGGDLTAIRAYRTDIYFLSPCSAAGPCDGAADVPSLKRMRLNGNQLDTETLVTGLGQMRFDFGIDRSGDGAPSADGASAAYVAMPASAQEWRDVMAVRVHLLARNIEPSPGYSDDKTYNMGLNAAGNTLTLGPFEDRFKRHVFTGLARAINRSSRRE